MLSPGNKEKFEVQKETLSKCLGPSKGQLCRGVAFHSRWEFNEVKHSLQQVHCFICSGSLNWQVEMKGALKWTSRKLQNSLQGIQSLILNYPADFNELEVITHHLSLPQDGTVSCARSTFSDQLGQILQPRMCASPVSVMQLAPETVASCVIR